MIQHRLFVAPTPGDVRHKYAHTWVAMTLAAVACLSHSDAALKVAKSCQGLNGALLKGMLAAGNTMLPPVRVYWKKTGGLAKGLVQSIIWEAHGTCKVVLCLGVE